MSATEWKFVPAEATDVMVRAGVDTPLSDTGNDLVDQPQDYRDVYRAMIAAAPSPAESTCRTDGRCEYAIQIGAEKEGSCPAGACAMPCDNQSAHLTIPGALEWDGDNGTHGVVGTHSADGESRADGESKPGPTPIGEGMARLMHAYDLGEFSDEGGSATVEAMSCESFDNSDRSDLQFESYTAGYQQAIYEQGAPLLHEVGRLKSFRLAYMEWSDKTDWVQDSAQPRELGKHRADVIAERFKSLRAQLAERDHQLSLLGTCLGEILVASGHVSIGFGLSGPQLLQFGEELRDSMTAKIKPKTCIECAQPYCHGVCVERGDQDYDRDQAAKGGDDE